MRAVISSTCLQALLLCVPSEAESQTVTEVSQALPFAMHGKVELVQASSSASTLKTNLASPTAITAGGRISTGGNGSATVILSGVGTVQMDHNTDLQIPAETTGHSLELLKGRLFLQISHEDLQKRKAGEFRLKTPAALLAVKGTRFFVDSGKGGDVVALNEGSVLASEPESQSTVTLAPGQAVSVSTGKISPPRPQTAKELGAVRVYDDIALVRTPFALVARQPGTPFNDQEGVVLDSFGLSRDGIWLGPNDSTPAEVPRPGEMRWSLRYDYAALKRDDGKKNRTLKVDDIDFGSGGSLYLKGNVWRAKHHGLAKVVPLLGMQLQLRLKNVSRALLLIDTGRGFSYPLGNPPQGTVILEPPVGVPQSGTWERHCVVPFSLSKAGENSDHRLHILIYPEGPFDAAGKPRADIAEVSITDCMLVSQPK